MSHHKIGVSCEKSEFARKMALTRCRFFGAECCTALADAPILREVNVENGGGTRNAFWDKVEIYRRQKNLTYRAIARTMGKAETTVSSMRQFGTEPRISDGIKIADALGVDIRDLAG